MIKRLSLVALAVFAAGNANAIQVVKDAKNDVQLNALVHAGYFFGDEKTSEYYGNNTFVRGGASGKTKINDDISAIGFYEGQIKLSNAESEAQKDSVTINGTTYNTNSSVGTNLTTRFVYGGLDVKNVGAFTFGRQFGAIKHVVGWTDVGLTSDYTGNATGNAADKFGTGRSSDQFKYVGTFGQAKVFTNYKFASNRDTATLDKDSTAFGFGSSYDISQKVSIGAAYADGHRAQTTAGVDAKDAKLWVTGAKYDDKTIYAALVYANGTDFLAENVDHTAFETALGYTFKNGFGLLTTWEKQRVDNNGTKQNGYNAYTLGTTYAFSKALSVAAEYRINNREKTDYSAFTEYGVSGATKVDSANDFQLAVKYLF